MRVIVVGAGIVGSCVALALARAGCDVIVVDRAQVGSGTTSRGEGNVLVSDKSPGPELALALLSVRRWAELAEELGADRLEFQRKGGLVTSRDPEALPGLEHLAHSQREAGVEAHVIGNPHEYEPHLAPGIGQGVWYPQDAQVQPVRSAATILAEAMRQGACFLPGREVVEGAFRGGTLAGVHTKDETLFGDAVVNAGGTWGGEVGRRLGAPVPVLPRRGFVLVTEPAPPFIRHKVYSADYVANVAADTEGLETSVVIESTPAGTVLIGASRERVGYDMTMAPGIVSKLALQAVELFPRLAALALLRVYRGFRPYCPDHLPVIGPDPRMPGLLHACGHEGAGIGLAPATGDLVTAYLTGGDVEAVAGGFARQLLPDRLVDVGGQAGGVS